MKNFGIYPDIDDSSDVLISLVFFFLQLCPLDEHHTKAMEHNF